MDRLRAKKPVTDTDEWDEGVISEVDESESTVKLENGIELSLTSELIKLYRSRLESEEEGAKIWYKKKE